MNDLVNVKYFPHNPSNVTISTGYFSSRNPVRKVQSNNPKHIAKMKCFLLKYERVYLVLHHFSELLTPFRGQLPLYMNVQLISYIKCSDINIESHFDEIGIQPKIWFCRVDQLVCK